MKHVKVIAFVVCASALWTAAQQQPTSSTATARRKSSRPASTLAQPDVTVELEQMKTVLQQQQQEIQQLKDQLAVRDQAVQTVQQQAQEAAGAATQASTKADQAAAQATEAQQNLSGIQTDMKDLKANATTAALSLQDEQKRVNDATDSPLALHYKGVTLTPGGFFAAETVWRQHAMASDDNTPFNSVPFTAAGAQHLSEFYGTGRPTRITMLIEGKTNAAKLSGYYEMDFLSSGTTSNNNGSNSYTQRQRQVWGKAELNNGWSFTGGQMWSLVTETKVGLNNRTEATPSVIDHQYHVGFSWARQYGFRIVKNFNNKVWLGFSIENAQTTFAAHGNAANFDFGSLGNNGGLYNAFNGNYSFNRTPDFVVKAAFEPHAGHHYEIFGVLSDFRDRIYPNATATPASSAGAFNDTRLGGGVGANARWIFANKHVEFGLHAFGGDGVGRYGTSGLPDVTVRPDGTLAPMKAYMGLGTLEFHSTHWDWYTNVGTEYVQRTWYRNAAGAAVGYGAPTFNNAGCFVETVPSGGNGFSPGGVPGTCTGDTKNLVQGTLGFYYKFYNGPKGRIQWGPQYSYFVRNAWTGAGGAPTANESMVMTSFRYYLP